MIEKILSLIYIDEFKFNYKEMIKSLGIKDKSSFNKALDELKDKKVISKDKDNKFVKSNRKNIYFGKYESTRKGFGFLLLPDEKDIFIPRSNLNGAMDGDMIIIKTEIDKGRKVGRVIYIVKREIKELVGRYESSKSFGFVVPLNYNINYDIYIPKKFKNKSKDSDIVYVSILKYPKDGKKPEGIIKEILGKEGSKGIYLKVLMKKYNLNDKFKDKVLKEAESLDRGITEKEIRRRRDLRNLPIITIDGEDAKDLDDAVYVEKLGDNYKLSVHIADVSHYVSKGSNIDKEAYERGTSVYLINKVIPMLPERLSNDLCSLNENTDKLTLSCEMIINPRGEVIEYDIFESIIRTKYRMTYNKVQDILDHKEKSYSDIHEMIFNMKELSLILKEKRNLRGSIDFDFKECKILLDDNDNVIDISAYERYDSHKIIEEFMLLCNETVGEHVYFLNYPFPYRVHEEPDIEKILELQNILYNLNYNFKIRDKIYPKDIQKVLEDFKGKDEEMFLSKLVLRSMAKAKYSKECLGHFGLSTRYYCHFTSPIRRYPDLIAHRIIKLSLKGRLNDSLCEKIDSDMALSCSHLSEREILSESSERELYDRKMCEYMEDKIGREYEGIIISITNFGFFAELPNTVRGLVHINDIKDDEYFYDEENMILFGRENKNVFKIGMKVRVSVLNVIIEENEIYFKLC